MASPESRPTAEAVRRRSQTAAPIDEELSSATRPVCMPARAMVEASPRRTGGTALHHAAEGFARPSRACVAHEYLDEFHMAFEPLVDAMECELAPMLRDAGASADLQHEWSLAMAALQDFLSALGEETERLRVGA